MKTVFNLHPIETLVTGSSKGIGLGIANYFKDSKSPTLYHGSTVKSRPDTVEADDYIAADLMADDGPGKLVKEAFGRRAGLNTLIANAGSFFDEPFLEMSRENFRKTMRLNVEATFVVCQSFAQHLVAARRPGSIVIISSTNAFQAEEDSVGYDTSKGALYMMTRSLALTLARHKIRVNGVAPGLIRTPLTQTSLDGKPGKVDHYNRKILLERIGDPEDCAGACAFLASEAAGYVTGHVIVVDGGLTVGQIGRMPED